MKTKQQKAIGFIAVLDILFAIFLLMSGAFDGIMSTVFYIFAFAIPIFMGFFTTREGNSDRDFLSFEGARLALPAIAPTVFAVILISLITSAIVSAITGKSNTVDLGGSLAMALITHALAPAILEEALFRYIPLRVMRGERWPKIILYSAIFFGLIHHSFFSIPYAFVAGAVFMLVDLIADSVWPSVIIHFVNNALSVLWMFFADSPALVWVSMAIVAALTVVSVIYVISNKDKYKKFKEEIMDFEGIKEAPPREVWILAILMLTLAIMELI